MNSILRGSGSLGSTTSLATLAHYRESEKGGNKSSTTTDGRLLEFQTYGGSGWSACACAAEGATGNRQRAPCAQ